MKSSRKRLVVLFGFCAIVAITIAYIAGELRHITHLALIVVVIGILNSLAVLCQWQAVHISLSKTSLFTFWDDLIGMGLAALFLHETQVFNTVTALGMSISIFAVILFAVISYRRRRLENSLLKNKLSFYFYVLGYSVIWGLSIFVYRHVGLEGLSTSLFLASWYVGSALGASMILLLGKTVYTTEEKLPLRHILWMLGLGIAIMSANALTYVSYLRVPLNIAQPIFLVGEMVLPAFIGLYIFHERNKLTLLEKLLFALGLIGSVIIACNFQ